MCALVMVTLSQVVAAWVGDAINFVPILFVFLNFKRLGLFASQTKESVQAVKFE